MIISIPHVWGLTTLFWSVASTFLYYECRTVRVYPTVNIWSYLSQYYELKAHIRLKVKRKSPSLPLSPPSAQALPTLCVIPINPQCMTTVCGFVLYAS